MQGYRHGGLFGLPSAPAQQWLVRGFARKSGRVIRGTPPTTVALPEMYPPSRAGDPAVPRSVHGPAAVGAVI